MSFINALILIDILLFIAFGFVLYKLYLKQMLQQDEIQHIDTEVQEWKHGK